MRSMHAHLWCMQLYTHVHACARHHCTCNTRTRCTCTCTDVHVKYAHAVYTRGCVRRMAVIRMAFIRMAGHMGRGSHTDGSHTDVICIVFSSKCGVSASCKSDVVRWHVHVICVHSFGGNMGEAQEVGHSHMRRQSMLRKQSLPSWHTRVH